MKRNWYYYSTHELAAYLKTDLTKGLLPTEVLVRQKNYGFHTLPLQKPPSWPTLFIKQLNNSFFYILMAAAVLKVAIEGYRDAFIILFVICVSALVTTFQEKRAYSLLATLHTFINADALVIREGKSVVVAQKELVPGDVIIIQKGNKVPADARIIKSYALHIDESSLTGESLPVLKNDDVLTEQKLPVFEQSNMVFWGTVAVAGHARAVVVATGSRSYWGSLQQTISSHDIDLPLKKDLATLSYVLLLSAMGIVALFTFSGILLGKEISELIFTMTSLLVSIVPTGIPVVSTIIMAQNAYRMAKDKVLVKNLQAIDALGRIEVLVVDKTGTLTRNEQMVSKILTFDKSGSINLYQVSGNGYEPQGNISRNTIPLTAPFPPELLELGSAAAMVDSSEITFDATTNRYRVKGEPLQAAGTVFSQKIGLDKRMIQKNVRVLEEEEFDYATRKKSLLIEESNGEKVRIFFGSPEGILQLCGLEEHEQIARKLKELLDEGLRIIAFAIKQAAATQPRFLGLLCMHDKVRITAARDIASIEELGVKVVIATGDHRKTALAVAKEIGLKFTSSALHEGEIYNKTFKPDTLTLAARVTPQDKVNLIESYHQKRILVGMTGDGANDVPALRAADVGIAMGGWGTDVAQDAADIVLLDDSLYSISKGILLGRHAFDAMRRVLIFVLSVSAAEIIIIALTFLLGAPLPLLATQILWIHMLTDGLLDIAIGMEPQDERELKNRFIGTKKLIDRALVRSFFIVSLPTALAVIILFLYFETTETLAKGRTIALITLAMCQWWNAWNMRSESRSLFSLNPLSNRWLALMTLLVIGCQAAALYVPLLQKLLYTVPLSTQELLLCFTVSSLVLWSEELRKCWATYKSFPPLP